MTDQALLAAIVESSDDAIVSQTLDGIITSWNPAAERLFGFTADEAVGKPIAQILPSGEGNLLGRIARGETIRRYETVRIRRDGSAVDVSVTLSAILDHSGRIVGASKIIRDISERKKVETAFRESGNKLQALFEAVNDCILILDRDGRVTDINRTGHERLGYTKDEMVGKSISQFDVPEFASLVAERIAGIMEKGYGIFESAHVRKDGSVMPVEVSAQAIELDGQLSNLSVIRDISERKATEAALLKSEANFRSMMDNSPYLTWMKDTEGRYLAVNKIYADYLGLAEPGQAIGKTDLDLQQKRELAEKYRADDAEVMASRRQKHVEEAAFDGQRLHWVETVKTPVIDAHGSVLGTVGSARDITERKAIEADLRIAAAAFDAQEAIVITDADGVILRVNQAFIESTGYAAEEIVGRTPRLLKSGRHDAAFYTEMWTSLRQAGGWQGEIWDRRKNGEIYPKWLNITAVKGADGGVTHYVATHTDITERKAAEEKIRDLAFYDPLTRLPNRRLLLDRLHMTLAASTRHGREGALLFVDLDNFKMLNDTQGHDKGDLLLQEVARRLTACVRDADTVARLGGDEFVVLLEDLSENPEEAATQAETVGEKILAAVGRPYLLAGHEYHSTPSVGITLFGDQRGGIDELLKQADIAMYQAKAAGRNTMRFFDPELQAAVQARTAMEQDLRQGITNGQFFLHYQAQVEDDRIVGAEALVRWRHPERGTVSPAEFIPLAEETGLILPLGQWVLETACAQIAAWAERMETADITLAVNVSARQFRQPDFVEEVVSVLERTNADPSRLKLELTESLVVDSVEEVVAKMTALKERGLSFSLDDFGTGYSSLSYLKRLPLSQLKIDQSFVRDVLTDPNDAAIARTIVALAQSMGLGVIAEGVETEDQRDFLARQSCHAFQGFLFGRPLPVEEFGRLFQSPG